MEKEVISQKQGTVIMITFLLGSTLVLGAGSGAEQDSWLAILLSMLMAAPMLIAYAGLLAIYPGKDLFLILETVYGKIIGKIVSLVYCWYAFHLGALVIRNFVEFITIVSLPETPKYMVGILMTLVCIWGVKSGIEVLGRWTSIILPIIILSLVIVSLLCIPLVKLENFKPVLYKGFQPVLKSAYSVFTFPFAETVLMLAVLGHMRSKSSPYKVYMKSLLIAGIFIMLISARSVAVLGVSTTSVLYFASYSTVGLIDIGNFLQRIEVSVSIVFMLAGFIKICVCLFVACKGLSGVIKITDYRKIVAPVGLLMFILSFIIYTNTMEMFDWAEKIYPYYVIPFQIILPLLTLAVAVIKKRLKG